MLPVSVSENDAVTPSLRLWDAKMAVTAERTAAGLLSALASVHGEAVAEVHAAARSAAEPLKEPKRDESIAPSAPTRIASSHSGHSVGSIDVASDAAPGLTES